MKRFLTNLDINTKLVKKPDSYQRFIYSVLNRYQSQQSKLGKRDNDASKEANYAASHVPGGPKVERNTINYDPSLRRSSSDEDDFRTNRWKLELAWLSKALEPALQLCRWALPGGNGSGDKTPPSNRSLTEILSNIQRSKLGLQDWSLSDLTIGLYLIYLRQASTNPFEDVKGEVVSSDSIVQDLIYHIELAKGTYRDNAAGLAKNSMLRESNVVKFIKYSSLLRPGYYVGIDTRKKLVILGIRGTHTVYDLITDIASSSNEEVTFEGYSTHFGTAEAAHWFFHHEMETIRKCLDKHEGFRLRLVGHSLGGAIASLLAIMLRRKSPEELGFSPDIVSAVGYGTPPCVSRELAENCSDFVTTVIMQDDIVPRLSVASLTRLRNEILETDWMSVFEKEDWRSVIELVTNAKQVMSSVQDVARRLTEYARLRRRTNLDFPVKNESHVVARVPSPSDSVGAKAGLLKKEEAIFKTPELFVPGALYYLKRDVDTRSGSSCSNGKAVECFSLWRRPAGEHFLRIRLCNNILSDHRCDSHFFALRDVLKGLPGSSDGGSSDERVLRN